MNHEKMEIALIGRFFAPVFGGVEVHMENLGRQMVKRGHGVTVFTGDTDNRGQPLPAGETRDGLRVVRVRSARVLARTLRAWDGDLFHFHLIHKPFVALAMRAVRKDPRPRVFTPHCVYPSRSAGVRLVKALYDPTLGRMSLRLANRIICLTENDKADILGMGASEERIVLIPNALAEERFDAVKANPEEFKRKFGVDQFLLYVGRIDWVKGLEFAVDAMAELKKSGLHFVCVGQDFGMQKELEARAERLGVSDVVKFTGPVDQPTLASAYAACTAFLLPSRYEGLPTAPMEAMWFGKPVITTLEGGTRYLIEDGMDGLAIPYGDAGAIVKRAQEILEGKHPEVGRRAREKVLREYTWSKVGGRIERLYRELVGGR